MAEGTPEELAKKYEANGYKGIAAVVRHLAFASVQDPKVQLVVPFDQTIIPLPPASWVEERSGKQHLMFRLSWLNTISVDLKPNDAEGFGLIDAIAAQAVKGLAERSSAGRG